MNLLPKKSWHVKSRKNIERVKRDEAEAERKGELELERKLRVEQELRLEQLRKRAGLDVPSAGSSTSKPLNLFEGVEHSTASIEQVDKRRQANAANYQRRLVRAADVSQPWYCHPSRSDLRQHTRSSSKLKSVAEADATGAKTRPSKDLITSMYDPMTAMKHAEQIHRQRKAERRR